MGNTALQREYTISETVSATGGNDHLWRIFPAVHKTTKQEVCVFMATKKDIETQYGPHNSNAILNRLKLEAQLLARLRHPNILNLHTLHVEGAKEVYTVTEPILGSLSNLLKNYKNLPSPMESIRKFEFFPVELRMGMCQIAEALEYCHNELKLAHLNISPENIYITAQGAWKLAGFNFSYFESYQRATEVPQIIVNSKDSVVKFGQRLQKSSYLPSLNYSAPEYVVHHQPSLTSDIFSFGVLYYDLVMGMQSNRGLLSSSRNIEVYKQRVATIQNLSFEGMAKPMADSLLNTLSENPKTRLEIHTVLRQMSLFGNDVNALRILNTIGMRDAVSKARFLRPLPQLLQTMPERVLLHRVLPLLLDELKDMKTANFALPPIFAIAEKVNEEQYSRFIQPRLSKIFMQMQPPELPMKLLEHFDLMMDKSTQADQQNFMLPFLIRCFELGAPDVQIEAMKQTEKCLTDKRITAKDFSTIFLPKIDMLIRKTTSSVVRTNGAVCLGKASAKLDEDVQIQVIIPCLEHCLRVDVSTALVMTVVGVFSRISKLLPHKHIVALRILPAVIPSAVNTSLTEDQFVKYMKAVKGMMGLVEQQRMNMFANASTLARETEERRIAENKQHVPQRQRQQDADYNDRNFPPPPRGQVVTNGGRSHPGLPDDDLFEPPRRQNGPIKPKENTQGPVDDFLANLLPPDSSAEKGRMKNSQDLFGDDEDIADDMIPPDQSTSPREETRRSTENAAPEDNHLDDLMNRFMGNSPRRSSTAIANSKQGDLFGESHKHQDGSMEKVPAADDNLFKNLGEEWKSNAIASEKASPPKMLALQEEKSKGQTSGSRNENAVSPSQAPPVTSDFDNLLDRVTLEDDFDDMEYSDKKAHSTQKQQSSSSSLFEDSDPFSRINIDNVGDDEDEHLPRSSSTTFKSTSTSRESKLHDDNKQQKKSSFYDDEEDYELGKEEFSEMMASLGEPSTKPRTPQRTKSYFDDDDDDNDRQRKTAISSGQSQGGGGDLDDLMSRFM